MLWSLGYRRGRSSVLFSKIGKHFEAVRKFCATASTEETSDAVRAAYKVLGVPETEVSLRDIRKRYLDLVKIHHPDVSGNRCEDPSKVNLMVEINNAYRKISAFIKSGGRLDPRVDRKYGSSETFAHQCWEDPHYVPFYEMMWDEMRDHAASTAGGFQSNGVNENFRSSNLRWRGSKEKKKQSHKKYSETNDKRESKKESSSEFWSESDKTALMHMYEDGKSFDFIANALNKKNCDVVEEFNKWKSELHHRDRQYRSPPFESYRKGSDGWLGVDAMDDYLNQEDYDDIILDINPFDYEAEYEDDFAGAIPYQNRHRMSNQKKGKKKYWRRDSRQSSPNISEKHSDTSRRKNSRHF